jgi:hypothetical protein
MGKFNWSLLDLGANFNLARFHLVFHAPFQHQVQETHAQRSVGMADVMAPMISGTT